MCKNRTSGKSYDRRRAWLLERLRRYAPHFCIDILNFSIMANHLHLVLRNQPDLVEGMSDEEVIRAGWAISPKCRNRDGSPGWLTETRLAKLRKDKLAVRLEHDSLLPPPEDTTQRWTNGAGTESPHSVAAWLSPLEM